MKRRGRRCGRVLRSEEHRGEWDVRKHRLVPLLPLLAAIAVPPAWITTASAQDGEPTGFDGDLSSRSHLSGDWHGERDALASRGLTLDLEVTYTFQGVVEGGFHGPLFHRVSDESDTGNVVSGDLRLGLDVEKAGLWKGGRLDVRAEARAGRSVLQRAGSVSAVSNDSLFPNVVDRFDDEAYALTALTFTQHLGEKVAFFGGLLDTAEGDENEIAGSALSNSTFLNSAMLYSLVEDATVPNVSLGGGVLLEPNDAISSSFSVFGTQETAGEDPFDHMEGTTFALECTVAQEIFAQPGAQTLGFLYGIDASRTAIAADPRLVLGAILVGRPIPSTHADTWALYYNAHQYVRGDAERGWGAFVRLGVSDGDPNPVKWNAAGGLGGKGLLPRRDRDAWGIGFFYLGLSEADLLKGLGVGDEVGGELFYEFAATPWLRVTPDVQLIDSALPHSETAWVLGLRTRLVL